MMVFLHLTTWLCLAMVGHVKGQSTMCHSCDKFTNVTECDLEPPKNCTGETPYCKIVQEKTGIPALEMFSKVTTTKGCASGAECRKEDVSVFEVKYIWCCHSDLCNIFQNMPKEGIDGYNSQAQKSDPLPVIYAIALLIYFLYCT